MQWLSHKGLSCRKIAAELELPARSVARIANSNDPRRPPAPKGRPRKKVSPDLAQLIKSEMDKDPALARSTWQDLIIKYDLNCSIQTLIKAFKAEGWSKPAAPRKN